MDEPASALDPIATAIIEELIDELRANYTIVIVTHSMQQAARVSQRTAFFHLGKLIEHGATEQNLLEPEAEADRGLHLRQVRLIPQRPQEPPPLAPAERPPRLRRRGPLQPAEPFGQALHPDAPGLQRRGRRHVERGLGVPPDAAPRAPSPPPPASSARSRSCRSAAPAAAPRAAAGRSATARGPSVPRPGVRGPSPRAVRALRFFVLRQRSSAPHRSPPDRRVDGALDRLPEQPERPGALLRSLPWSPPRPRRAREPAPPPPRPRRRPPPRP